MKSSLGPLMLGVALAGVASAQPLRTELPKAEYKHIVIGKVKNVRSVPIFDGKAISTTEAGERAKSNETKWGKIVHTGELVIQRVLEGDLRPGVTVPVTWVNTGAARPDGRVHLPMCLHHHASIIAEAELRFGLLEYAANGTSWLFWEAAVGKSGAATAKPKKTMPNKDAAPKH
ncbi:MAG: hypothetical protein HKN82_08245 [Akkermansiaceae bacterium]|nr:hypothetical protein [Akkermansiaceae bacterium]